MYVAVGRKIVLVDELPQGEIPVTLLAGYTSDSV